MNFSIERAQETGLDIIKLKDNTNQTEIWIDTGNGARLHGFIADGWNVIDSYKTEEEMQEDFSLSYKSAKMSPFACRIENGKYSFNGKEYEFSKKFHDGSAIHGILYNKSFEVVESYTTESGAFVTLGYDYAGEEPGYPFRYRCEVSYTLQPGNKLTVSTTIFNRENFPIPVHDGWHPYFTLGNSIDDCLLQIATSKMLVFTEKLVPNGEFTEDSRFLSPQSLKGIRLDNSFLLEKPDHEAPVCILSNPVTGYSISFFAVENYPILQIYTPPHRKSIAIENLSGAPNCFNNGMGLKKVEDSMRFTLTLEIQRSGTPAGSHMP